MKKTGIWLDNNKAHIVTLKNKLESFNTIISNIEHYQSGGGSGKSLKGGPQEVMHDSKYLERKKHQEKAYFKNIATEIEGTDELVLFGPAETNKRFAKELYINFKTLSAKIRGIKKADSMTKNQVKAWVRDFFESI